jgi:hypothetical protein
MLLLMSLQGHACILSGHTMINGPLLEVLVEVELARDGALLVRPREHTGTSNLIIVSVFYGWIRTLTSC